MIGMIGKVSIAIISVSIVIFALMSVSSTLVVLAANENLTTNVTVTNVGPTVGTITCSPVSSGNFTPNVGANRTLSCWAVLTDNNGYGDINQSTLDTNFYNDAVAGADDLNTHYSNGTASNAATDCTWSGESGTNITVNCSYNIRYFIDPSPSGWTVNFSVQDSGGTAGSNTKVLGVTTTLALDVKSTSIEYGEVALGGTSTEKSTNITNWCNQQIDVKLRESQYSGKLYCPSTGSANITTDASGSGIRFNMTSGFTWIDGGNKLTGTSTPFSTFDLIHYDASTTVDGEETKNLYWKIKIPTTGVEGACSGQTEFVAIAG